LSERSRSCPPADKENSMEPRVEKFWMVVADGASLSSARYTSSVDASAEASYWARTERIPAHVMECVKTVVPGVTPVTWIERV